jgi:isoquinoline 1-oxidoreductase alpha subunit
MAITLHINGKPRSVDVDPRMPVLWVLRDVLDMTGTKFGCGVHQCGACTILVDGAAVRSCLMPVEQLAGRHVTTIEGASRPLRELQQAWIDHQVPQCGYCQSGMLMAATALLGSNANPSRDDIAREITNICRCGTYPRIERAILAAASRLRAGRR